ncbi:hypothetical protein SeMB42_g02677 [Synchytrium endobioticum]|nr:hypothetical protein SeMB42_g02677 [Synchytrium endobioticum]
MNILSPSVTTRDIRNNHVVGQPFAPEDLIISNADWAHYFVGGVSVPPEIESIELEARRKSEQFIQQQVAWTAHLSLPAIVFPFPCYTNEKRYLNYARVINSVLSSLSWAQAWITVPTQAEGIPDTWKIWNSIHALSEYSTKLAVLLELTHDLPDGASLNRWLAEPISAVRIPASVFLTNNNKYPVMSKRHQAFVQNLMLNNVQFVVSLPSDQPQHRYGGLAAYQQYIHHLYRSMPQMNIVDQFAKGYHDYLQAPLQPLVDNLESQTYAVFEQDPVKYREYENAIREALLDRMQTDTDSSVVIMVVGAGRGPLVSRALAAAESAGRSVHVYAVEKNPNAIVILREKERNEWKGQVTVVYGDMRHWKAPEKADILVSELLGSFGDNELAPECLDGAQGLLKDDGISIPSDYTAFISPLQSSKLHQDVSALKSQCHIETPYVVKFRAANELADSQELWSFVHPNRASIDSQPESPTFNSHNTRYASARFRIERNALMHGIAGYFETTLYKNVKLSIRPQTYSTGMLSWFPIFFPLKNPVLLTENSSVEVHMWRMSDTRKVWYEWTIVPNIVDASPGFAASTSTASAPLYIHNRGGRSYQIGL